MNGMLYVCLTVIWCSVRCFENNGFVFESPYVCKDDVCVKENEEFEKSNDGTAASGVMSQDFVYKNSSKNLIKIKYLKTNGKTTTSADSLKRDNIKKIGGNSRNGKLQIFSSTLEQTLLNYTESETELPDTINATEVITEVTFNDKDTGDTTTDHSIKDKTSTFIPKFNTSTTRTSSSESEIFWLQNFRRGKTTCFCDLTVNECDINCCCDGDCSFSHFKVFTECSNAIPEYDNNYCFKSNFIFQNNTSHKVVQNKGGLFCIVRDNLEVSLNYQTRSLITTLETFNKSLPKDLYTFSYKSLNKSEFISKDYEAGSLVWIVQNGELKPFGVPAPSMGLLCVSEVNVRYLINKVTVCSHQKHSSECGKENSRSVFHALRKMKIICNPSFINKSGAIDTSKICDGKNCIGVLVYVCLPSEDASGCVAVNKNATNLPESSCWNSVNKIEYHIWHNGSAGIMKFEAYIWLKDFSAKGQYFQTTQVKFLWWGSSRKVFQRSGSPGYITGKPILAGRKVYYTVNETAEKREAIKMSLDARDWLSVLGSEKGICSSKLRIPINFRESSQYMCSIKLTKENFGKDNCLELQNYIFNVLIGEDIVNATRDNFFNKFVATFGNSKVEETADWVPVLIDLLPISSSQTGFRSNYYQLICKNIITDLYIDVAYSSIGSFLTPQSKILGVSYRLGKHKDLIFYCDTPDCESHFVVRYFKLSSTVNFVDLTKPAIDAFAEPLTLDARLPNDFFYPFFSKGSDATLSVFVLIFSVSIAVIFPHPKYENFVIF